MHITTSILFLFLVIFCIGAAVGGLIERALKKRSNPPPPEPLPIAPTNKNMLAEAEDVEILRAWRTRSNRVWLDMDGIRLNNKTALQPGQYQRLLNLVLDLRPWLETTKPAAPIPETTQLPLRPAAQVAAAPQAPILAKKKNDAAADEAVKPAPVLDTIIQQIDKVLQAKLETSAFKDRGIELVEGPGGIVIVKDGINRYEGVDGIPDTGIKALIRQAVSDWEKGPK